MQMFNVISEVQKRKAASAPSVSIIDFRIHARFCIEKQFSPGPNDIQIENIYAMVENKQHSGCYFGAPKEKVPIKI